MASSNESALADFIANEIDAKGTLSEKYNPEDIITHVLVDFETAILTKILLSDSSNNSISSVFQDQVVHYINNLIENQSPLIYLASEIWSLYLVELKSIFQNITNLGSSINAMTHDTCVCPSSTTI
jgi:hypothetical protein